MLLLQLLDLSNGWNCRQIEFYKLKREENIAMKQLPRKKYIFEGKNQVHGLPQLMEKRDAHQIEFFMRYIGLMFLQRLLFQHIQSWNIRLIFFSLMQLRSVGSLSEVSHSKRPPWHTVVVYFLHKAGLHCRVSLLLTTTKKPITESCWPHCYDTPENLLGATLHYSFHIMMYCTGTLVLSKIYLSNLTQYWFFSSPLEKS